MTCADSFENIGIMSLILVYFTEKVQIDGLLQNPSITGGVS